MAEINLADALDNIASKTVTTRRSGLNDLKYILRHNQNGVLAKNLDDKAFHSVLYVLFQCALDERSVMAKAKTQGTRTSSITRLGEIAGALRLAVEAGVQVLKLKTARAVVDHVFDTIYQPSGGFCEQLALDYAKCVRALFRYQPHVEHLSQQWDHYTGLCINCLKQAGNELAEENGIGETASIVGSTAGISYRSSRSLGGTSQDNRSAAKQVGEEMAACVRLLTAAPNAPLKTKAGEIIWTMIEFLRKSGPTSRALPDAFTAINNVLVWSRINMIRLTQDVTSHLIRLVRQFWSSKSSVTTQMLVTVLLLRPYLDHAMRQKTALTLRTDLVGLLNVMQGEYASRQEREHLKLEDLRLEISAQTDSEDGKIATALFSLRCVGSRGETNWTLVYMMASIHRILIDTSPQNDDVEWENPSEDSISSRPRKRRRVADDFTQLIELATGDKPSARACAFQVLAFLAQQKCMGLNYLTRALDAISMGCADENGNTSSWAFLALATCVSQKGAADPALAGRCSSLWQLATRSLSNNSTCRTASFGVATMLQLRLVSQSSTTDLMQALTDTMDLNGPSQLSEAVSLMFRTGLRFSKQLNPGTSAQTADSVVHWLSQNFRPSKLDDRQFTSASTSYEPIDVSSLIFACLNQKSHCASRTGLRTWDIAARAWLLCRDHSSLVSYLLLNPIEESGLNADLWPHSPLQSSAPAAVPPSSTEVLVLSHLSSELTQLNSAWTFSQQDRSLQVTQDAYSMLCKACCILNCIANCVPFRDSRRLSQIQQQVASLLSSISQFMSVTTDESKADAFLVTASWTFSGLDEVGSSDHHQPARCEILMCQAVTKAVMHRHTAKDSSGDDDMLDLDERMDSQDSRQSQAPVSSFELSNDLDVAFGQLSLRSGVALYANLIVAVSSSQKSDSASYHPSSVITEYLLAQSDSALIASRGIIKLFPKLNLLLQPQDLEQLLDYFMVDLINKYPYAKTEVALGTVLDVMESQTPVWTDFSSESLYDLGFQAYEWFTNTALSGGFLSPNVQRRLAKLLRRLCDLDFEYPRNKGTMFVPNGLFALMQQQDCITLPFALADQISTIFDRFILSDHQNIFEDLISNLPEDIEWVEGIAMRLLFLSKLGMKWHSLLRHCVYYIFETAGRDQDSLQHAAHCIAHLAAGLPVKTPRKLFSLFAPQLLFTWQETAVSLTKLPFAAFQYNSLAELLKANEAEICAQLATRGKTEDLDTISKALKLLPGNFFKRSFAKCFAYAVGWDIVHEKDKANVESRLREAVGGKVQAKNLIHEQFPVILGYIYLTLQQDDCENKWLETRPSYERTLESLTEIKKYSHSTRTLPPSQQPYVRSKYLPDQVERLSRRMGLVDLPWTASTFTLTARMLLDALDETLGSLHSCLMIRRLRVLICMAGPCAYEGLALEMLIHSLRPFVIDSECADDTIGILQYLFHHGQTHLESNVKFLGGAVILLVLQMCKYAKDQQNRSTQESQHTETVKKMASFQSFLVAYFKRTLTHTGNAALDSLAEALGCLHLPSNARKDSPESSLLLFLLDQWLWRDSFCSKADAMEALKVLSQDFEAPTSVQQDCLGEDLVSVKYSQPLWEVISVIELNPQFTAWAAQVLGRAYATTGARPTRSTQQSAFVKRQADHDHDNDLVISQATLAEKWCDLLFSRRRSEAGLAEYSLRKFFATQSSDPDSTAAFQRMLPVTIHEATSEGNFGYETPLANVVATRPVDDNALRQALQHSDPSSIDDWTTNLAVIICRWASETPLIANLALLCQNVKGLAAEILPSMLHILLVKSPHAGATLRAALSEAITACLSEADPILLAKQRFFLELLLYLRSQPYPREATRVDRLRWLDVNPILSASAGSRCGMPAAALLFAESASPANQGNRRSSTRSSLSQVQLEDSASEELLLSIYQQVEEPDSYYGISQPASLNAVLHRLDHEADGFKGLMFRSAQLDSQMRQSRGLLDVDATGIMHSLSSLNFNSLTFALLTHGLGRNSKNSNELVSAAQALQQWDLSTPDSTNQNSTFAVLQELARSRDLHQIRQKLQDTIAGHAKKGVEGKLKLLSHSWHTTLANLTEIAEVVSSVDQTELEDRWNIMQARGEWMPLARYDEVKAISSNRHALYSVLRQNAVIQKSLHVSDKQCYTFETEALLHSSRLARGHSQLQDALTATTSLNDMVAIYRSAGLSAEAAIKLETACVLWDAGESSASVTMLRETLKIADTEKQDLAVGRAGLHARLAQQLAEARMEKPEEILSKYLKPAISHLKSSKDRREAGEVYYRFASFCDSELSNPANDENFGRMIKLRQGREDELEAIVLALKNIKKTGDDKVELLKAQNRAQTWLDIDKGEERRMRTDRTSFTHQSLQNYMLALQFTDEHDICVLRFFALWLENAGDEEASSVVLRYLREVPSWKFVLLMNQLMSRVEEAPSTFQTALQELLIRIFKDHPHQSLHHLFAASRPTSSRDSAVVSRTAAARQLYAELRKDDQHKPLLGRIWEADRLYRALAECTPNLKDNVTKCRLRDVSAADAVARQIPNYSLPPATLSIRLRPGANYHDVPLVKRFDDKVSIMTGISHPKVLTAVASNGQRYRQLFKGGNDDLRQDAIMEQVFEEVSKMLRNHKATRQRDLKVRTYKVVPLSSGCGIIEFVPNSIPINDFLKPAHRRYHPQDYTENKAREIIGSAAKSPLETRLREWRKVCEHLSPVLRHFFLERFDDPDEWFEKRTAYTRTTASISILGHVLGLGDRHNSNILLDEKTGEIVHIDLGVAFEAGRVLPIPERVPFRLTRDIIDGMGITKTEGVFRRCCEFTLEAVRADKNSIMTLLNVLRYDPLYSWSVSPLRAKRMQEAQETSKKARVEEEGSSKRKEQEAGEADRALTVVEKKLSNTLSAAAAVNELIQQATDEKHLATLFSGWGAFF